MAISLPHSLYFSLPRFLSKDRSAQIAQAPLLPVCNLPDANMTTSRRLADRKSAKFQSNITKRGAIPETSSKKGKDYPVTPFVLGFFIFVVIGSC
ncbi:hypothetical protein AMTR_s00013p00052990 [Amborella trichopoda]|uniref:Stress-associated endoplasmic reticulum protein n=1 Tax=Amborella trichopoda TaxID=13333 RepID=W1PP52_AMBTC|nr:hypothetical protein AMTR_s00013p00052990 [Amborella trichopoda]